MYKVPAEFMRQKNIIFGPITLIHAIGMGCGYLLGQALGGDGWLTLAFVAMGLVLTAVKVQGLALYLFVPLFVTFLFRKLSDDTVEPQEPRCDEKTPFYALYDEDGTPILLLED